MTNKELSDSLIRLEDKVDSLSKTIDELTGGKRALMWVTGVAVSAFIAMTTWIGLHHK